MGQKKGARGGGLEGTPYDENKNAVLRKEEGLRFIPFRDGPFNHYELKNNIMFGGGGFR